MNFYTVILSRLSLGKFLDFLATTLEHQNQRSKAKTWQSSVASQNLLSIPRCGPQKNCFSPAKMASLPATDSFLPEVNTRSFTASRILQQSFSADDSLSFSMRAREKWELADSLAHNHALKLLNLDARQSWKKGNSWKKHLPHPHQNSLSTYFPRRQNTRRSQNE